MLAHLLLLLCLSPALAYRTGVPPLSASRTAVATAAQPLLGRRRVAPLCATAIQDPVTLLHQDLLSAPGLDSLRRLDAPGLFAAMTEAYELAARGQRDEIPELKRRLAAAEELLRERKADGDGDGGPQQAFGRAAVEATERDRSLTTAPEQVLNDLLQLSENRTDTAAEAKSRARAVSRKFFELLRRVSGEPSFTSGPRPAEDDVLPVPGEGMVCVSALRARLRLLERHEKAGLVEYRIFAETLSRADGLSRCVGRLQVEGSEGVNRVVQLLLGILLFKNAKGQCAERMADFDLSRRGRTSGRRALFQ